MRRHIVALAALAAAAACTPKGDAGAGSTMAAAVDTTAIKAEIDGFRAQYSRLQVAGDAAGLAAMFSEQGGVDFDQAPRARGRAAIEATFKQRFAMMKPAVLEIMPTMTSARSSIEGSEIGTWHTLDSAQGKPVHAWGRFLSAYAKDSTGQWHLDYLIAFTDSMKPPMPPRKP
jgi:ketosteroid isomerase-like protein